MKKRKVIIFHEYYAYEHFLGLYSIAEEQGIEIDFNIIGYSKPIIKSILAFDFRALKKVFQSMLMLLKYMILRTPNPIIIGMAPYSRYIHVFKWISNINRVIYFTSFPYWGYEGMENRKTGNISKQAWHKFLYDRETLCVTKFVKDTIATYTKNTCVVYHSIDSKKYLKKFSFSSDNEKRSFVFIGSFNKRKRVEWILKFLEDNEDLNITVTFIGKGTLKDKIINSSREDQRIICLGWKDKQYIQKNLYKYDYLLLPSKEEPFGIVIIEGMCCGVVPIASNCQGAQTVIRDNYNGFIFQKEDFQSFCNAIYKAINIDTQVYSKLSHNCIDISSLFDMKVIGHLWYEKIFNHKNVDFEIWNHHKNVC